MKKGTKIWLLVATALTLLGSMLFVGVMMAYGWDFSKLSTVRYETVTHDIDREFQSISVETVTADIRLLPSEDGVCKVVCHQEEHAKHSVTVEDGVLRIVLEDDRAWYERVGIHFGESCVTVYLPEKEYRALSVNVTTGDILMGDLSAETVSLSVTTGDMELSDLACRTLTANSTTGDVSLQNVIAAEKLFVKTTTGDVELEACDGGEIAIHTTTGDVEGSLLTGKDFDAETSTGDVRVPRDSHGGRCEISTSTGDIEITIE